MRKKYANLDTELSAAEDIVDLLIETSSDLMGSMPADQKDAAANRFITYLTKSKKLPERVVIMKAMGSIVHPAVRAGLAECAQLGATPAERVAALDGLAKNRGEDGVEPGVHALGDDYWQVRAAAIKLLQLCRTKACVAPLIALLDREDGRLLTEISGALKQITKRNYHDNAELWRRWWKDNEAAFDPETAGTEVAKQNAEENVKDAKGSYFFGIRTRSKNIIYVLDISGSMNWSLDAPAYEPGSTQAFPPTAAKGKRRYDYSKTELIQSIRSLPDDGTFNIVYYNGEVFVWKKKMQTATAANKATATKWAESIEPGGNTNIFDSIEKAFGMIGRGSRDDTYKLAADTVFFLSDGRAYRGRITDPKQMLREVKKMNSLKKVQIHTVSLGRNSDHEFMEKIAKQNDGQCVVKQ